MHCHFAQSVFTRTNGHIFHPSRLSHVVHNCPKLWFNPITVVQEERGVGVECGCSVVLWRLGVELLWGGALVCWGFNGRVGWCGQWWGLVGWVWVAWAVVGWGNTLRSIVIIRVHYLPYQLDLFIHWYPRSWEVLHFFFHKRGNKASNTFLKVQGGGGGWIWRNFVHIFCILEKEKETQGYF